MTKQDLRNELASLNFTEKIGILEKLRDRSLALTLVRLSLADGPLNLDQENHQKLEESAQRYLNAYLKSEAGSGSLSVLHEVLRHWVEYFRGKVRLEIDVDGKPRWKEITKTEELDSLLGPGQTPSGFLRSLRGESSGW